MRSINLEQPQSAATIEVEADDHWDTIDLNTTESQSRSLGLRIIVQCDVGSGAKGLIKTSPLLIAAAINNMGHSGTRQTQDLRPLEESGSHDRVAKSLNVVRAMAEYALAGHRSRLPVKSTYGIHISVSIVLR